jgi:hypothetical protein
MNRMRSVLILGTLVLLALSTSGLFGQTSPKQGYLEFQGENQTRNIPAGTVMDPASHLTYIVDTGVNARKLTGNVALSGDANQVPLLQRFPDLAINNNPALGVNKDRMFRNFISITNTHPTQAVTIHFRYFNDNCEDLLDFLVVLTCSDTLLFDPFDFVIPDTLGQNTSYRFFRAPATAALTPISTSLWGSGRFVITAAAAGTSIDADSDAEFLFPNEASNAVHGECNINRSGTAPTAGASQLAETVGGQIRNVGIGSGLVANNLHVFNAANISFDYLTGNQTTAVPAQFISDAIPGDVRFLAYGLNPWGRPSVDRNFDNDVSTITGNTDGDGPQVEVGKILLGSEPGFQSDRQTAMPSNLFYLRNEVHGGDIRFLTGTNTPGGNSHYGALGSSAFHIVSPENMVQHFISVADDYNGNSNTGVPGLVDRAGNIAPAITTFVLQIYDQSEDVLLFTVAPPLNISPPVVGEVVDLKMNCLCLRTWLTSVIAPGTNVDDVTIQDMADIFGSQVLTGLGAFNGLLASAVGEDPSDESGGWIRYVRDNSGSPVSISTTAAAANGIFFSGTAHGTGTSTFDVIAPGNRVLSDSGAVGGIAGFGPSFLVAAQQVVKFEGFGGAWWNFASASDPRISQQGAPCINVENGVCQDTRGWVPPPPSP